MIDGGGISHLPTVGLVCADFGDACCASFSTFFVEAESLNERFFLLVDLLARCLEKLSDWYLALFDPNMLAEVSGIRKATWNAGLMVGMVAYL